MIVRLLLVLLVFSTGSALWQHRRILALEAAVSFEKLLATRQALDHAYLHLPEAQEQGQK